MLLLLPGAIPIPSFVSVPSLPSTEWINLAVNMFEKHVVDHLSQPPSSYELHKPVPFPPYPDSPTLSSPSSSSSTSSLSSCSPITPTSKTGPVVITMHGRVIPRTVRPAPLLVRAPTPSGDYPEISVPSVYTPQGRASLLASLGVPPERHDPLTTKILIVSFGGQVFRRPTRTPSRAGSRDGSRAGSPEPFLTNGIGHRDYHHRHHHHHHKHHHQHRTRTNGTGSVDLKNTQPLANGHGLGIPNGLVSNGSSAGTSPIISPIPTAAHNPGLPPLQSGNGSSPTNTILPSRASPPEVVPRLATPSHIWIPGAPPVSKPPSSPVVGTGGGISRKSSLRSPPVPYVATIPPTPKGSDFKKFDAAFANAVIETPQEDLNGIYAAEENSEAYFDAEYEMDDGPLLLPDDSWIAVVCGVSKEQWNAAQADGEGGDLPEGFYVAPRDIYMPDLTAAGDVLLGKLGYGTVSECVDACTPFVYVSRPLFIEEHGLRLLLERDGVGVELARTDYEAGDWATAVNEAYMRGKTAKEDRRQKMAARMHRAASKDATQKAVEGDDGIPDRAKEGRQMALGVVNWVRSCTDSGILGEAGQRNNSEEVAL
ncbi:hypothetical protein HGRIS_003837 [Hohenbuehelia grisea]